MPYFLATFEERDKVKKMTMWASNIVSAHLRLYATYPEAKNISIEFTYDDVFNARGNEL